MPESSPEMNVIVETRTESMEEPCVQKQSENVSWTKIEELWRTLRQLGYE